MSLATSNSEFIELGTNNKSKMCTEAPQSRDRQDGWQLFWFPLNVVNHVLVGFVTGYLVYLCRNLDGQHRTNQHAVLCTIGYVFLMSEAIVALAGENLPTRSLNRRSSAHVHWFLQVIGVLCIFAGFVIKYQHREDKYGSHFASTHSVVGLISVAGLVVVCLSGLPALFAVRLRKRIRPVSSKFGHNLLGTICFVLGMVAQCLGYQTKSIKRQAEGMVLWMTLGTALITVLSLVGAVRQLKAHSLSVRKNIFGW